MKKDKLLATALFVCVLAVLTQMECQLGPRPLPLPIPPPRPLCASQFALVNYACSTLPYNPAPPATSPSPPSPDIPASLPEDDDDDDDDESVNSRHRHRHGHRHGHGGSHVETPEEESCCRWLKEVDNECVCDLLVRLPVFLARPVHEYTVFVDDSCNVTYSCSGRLHP